MTEGGYEHVPGHTDTLLGCNKDLCGGVNHPAVDPNLPFSTCEGFDVAHLDVGDGELLEESLPVLCVVCHNVHMGAWGAL